MDVIEKLTQVKEILDEIDEYDASLTNRLSICDTKTSDLLHLIENNTLKSKESYRVIKEIKNIRNERREIKNDMELLTIYKNNILKIVNSSNRQFLLSELHKRCKCLNKKYKNKVYTDEDIANLLNA